MVYNKLLIYAIYLPFNPSFEYLIGPIRSCAGFDCLQNIRDFVNNKTLLFGILFVTFIYLYIFMLALLVVQKITLLCSIHHFSHLTTIHR